MRVVMAVRTQLYAERTHVHMPILSCHNFIHLSVSKHTPSNGTLSGMCLQARSEHLLQDRRIEEHYPFIYFTT